MKFVAAICLLAILHSNAFAEPVLYGTEIDGDTLFTVDLATGAATIVGVLGPTTQVEGLAFNPTDQTFFAVSNNNQTLLRISVDPISVNLLQPLPLGTYPNLARHPISGALYIDRFLNNNTIAILDPQTGLVTPVGPTGNTALQSLSFDASGRLFGIRDLPAPGEEALYEIDPNTGAVLSTVAITSDQVNPRFDNSLAIHPVTGTFYTVAAIEGSLYEINPTTGIATRIGHTGRRNIRSLDFADFEPTVLQVTIDIKPGSDPNCFNQNGHGVIPVAVLGSADFDVSEVDQSTLSFGGLGVRVRGNNNPMCSLSDANDDGIWDLVCQFEDDSNLWAPGDGEATLTGELLDGTTFEGTDSICVVP